MGTDSITVLMLRLRLTQAHPISCSIRLTWGLMEAIPAESPSQSLKGLTPNKGLWGIPEPLHPTCTSGGYCIEIMGSWVGHEEGTRWAAKPGPIQAGGWLAGCQSSEGFRDHSPLPK